jgi:hypothetical protein
MSVYTETANALGIYPKDIHLDFNRIIDEEFEDWDLPKIDILEIWGSMSLRAAVGLLSGGDTPTTYSKRMADAIRFLTDPAPDKLLGFDDEPVHADYTRTQVILKSIREPVDAEVVDD